MVTAWSGAWRSRPSRSCRSAPRPMVIPSAAALRMAVIWDANLGLRLHAAQEFRLVDHRDAKRLRLRELRAGIGAGHHRGGLLRHAVRDVAPRGLDHLGRPGARQGRERSGDHVGPPRERPPSFGRDRLRHVEAKLLQPVDQPAVLGRDMTEPVATEGRGPLAGRTYVITGTLPTLSRARATEVIEAAGGHVTDGVSKQTAAVVAGADAGSKLAKAKALGVPVIDEAELLRRVQAQP